MKTALRLTLALLFCVMLCLCLIPMAFADAGDYTIPANTSTIEDGAFSGCTEMETVTIPAGVTSIGDDAFSGCTGLTDVYFDGTQAQWRQIVKGTGNEALTKATLYCADSTIYVNSGEWYNLTWTLDNTGALTISGTGEMVDLPNYNAAWHKSYEDIRSVVIGNGVTSIGQYAFISCSGLTSVTIPESVTSIGNYTFDNCDVLTSVTIPRSVTSIGEGAFSGCDGLTSMTIPDSVISIGACAYQSCEGLTNLTIGNSVTSIGGYAFSGCIGLKSVTIPESVNSIGNSAFRDCSGLTSVMISDSVISIGNYAFSDCSGLKGVTIGGCVTSIGDYAFSTCSELTSMTIPDSVTSIGEGAFQLCGGLTRLTIGNGLTHISDKTFRWCSGLTSVTMPEGVTDIGTDAFYGCSGLTSVTIPGSVTGIGYRAFEYCFELKAVYYGGSESQWGEISFNVYSGLEGINKYYNTTGPDAETKKTMFGIIQQGDDWAMRWLVTYTEQNGTVTDPKLTIRMDGVDTSDSWKFTTSLTDPDTSPWLTATGIDKTAFVEISIRGSAQNPLHIINHQFSGYTGVKDLKLSHVKTIDTGAFENCTSLVRVDGFDSDLYSIASSAFKNDEKLTTVYGSNNAINLSTIGAEAFMNTSLLSFGFCKNVTTIGARAFYSAKLGSVTLGRNVEEIGAEAFAGNLGLTIYCYRDSEALQYAVDENIENELLDGYSDHVVFRGDMYKENNTLTNVSFGWGFDLFENTSSVPNKDLTIASLVLAADAYDWDLLKSAFKGFGLENPVPHRYDGYDSSIDHVAFGIASQVEVINGVYTNIIIVACRGSTGDFFSSDDWQSNISNQADGFSYAATDVHNRLCQYINDYVDTSYPTKLLITGHSRGGAVANILGTMVSDITSSENVYVYTFACPNTTDDMLRYNYSIFNIVVDGDPVPFLPSFTPPPYTCDDNKYGKTIILKASVDDARFIRVFQDITGGVSTAAIDNNADCVCGYPGLVRHHVPAVYLSCLLEPCGTATGYSDLTNELERAVMYNVSTFSR